MKNFFFPTLLLFSATVLSQVTLEQDLNPGAGYGNPYSFTSFNDNIYFFANNGIETGLMEYNGTDPATMIQPTNLDYYPNYLIVYHDKLYFAVDDGTVGSELWSFDGTTTEMVADLYVDGSKPGFFAVYDDLLYFAARDEAHGREIFSYDGETTPVAVTDISPTDSDPKHLTVFDDKLYFTAWSTTSGYELWSYDGISPTLVVDIAPGSESSYPFNLFLFNDKLYFVADDNTNGIELWSYDGSEAEMVEDIYPGSGSSGPGSLAIYNDEIHFSCYDGEEWNFRKFDGSSPSEVIASGFPLGSNSCVYQDTLFFGVLDLTTFDEELWYYSGEGTPELYAEIEPGDLGSNPAELTVVNNVMYFSANDGSLGAELWSLRIENGSIDDVSIPENEQDIQLSVYPNPGSTHISIQTNQNVEWIELYTALGNKVNTYSGKTMNIAELARGQYFLRIMTDKGLVSKIITLN